jgi:hypothetical protein
MKRTHRIHRLLSLPAGAALALLALFGGASAALASPSKVPGSGGAAAVPVPSGLVRIVTVGGIADWQVAVIALIAALIAATAAVAIDRALAARRRALTAAT